MHEWQCSPSALRAASKQRAQRRRGTLLQRRRGCTSTVAQPQRQHALVADTDALVDTTMLRKQQTHQAPEERTAPRQQYDLDGDDNDPVQETSGNNSRPYYSEIHSPPTTFLSTDQLRTAVNALALGRAVSRTYGEMVHL